MGELLEGLLELGPEAAETISKVEELTAALTNLAEVVDAFFGIRIMATAFQNIQEQFKGIGPLLEAAAKQGKLEGLLGDAFEAAVERLGNLLFDKNFWTGLGEMILGAFEMSQIGVLKIILNIGVALKSVLDKAFQDVFQEIGKIPKVGKLLGLSDAKAESFSEIYENNRRAAVPLNTMLDKLIGEGTDFFTEGRGKFQAALNDSKAGPAQAQLDALVQSLSPEKAQGRSKIKNPATAADDATTDGTDNTGRGSFKPEFTSLEKMGFIMSGAKVQNPYDQRKIDLLQQIANNTAGRGAASVNLPPLGNTYMGIYSPMIQYEL